MPNMANITVKRADGTTDVVFNGLVASSGDRGEAIWRATALASAPALQPVLRVRSSFNGPRTTRRVEGSFANFYYVTPAGEEDRLIAPISGSFVFTTPQVVPAGWAADSAAFFGNLLASALMKDVNSSGFAPT